MSSVYLFFCTFALYWFMYQASILYWPTSINFLIIKKEIAPIDISFSTANASKFFGDFLGK